MTPDPLRVLFVVPGWPPGLVANGIVSAVGAIRHGLAAAGVASRVLSTTAPVAGPEDPDVCFFDATHDGLPRRAWRRLTGRRGDRWDRLRRGVRHVARDWAPDVVEVEESFGLAAAVRDACPARIVVRLHGPWFLTGAAAGVPHDDEFRSRVEAEGRAIQAADGVSAPCRFVLEQVEARYGLLRPDARVIANAVQAPTSGEDFDRPDDHRIVLFVGRVDFLKGADIVLDAFSSIAAQIGDARLCVVGPDHGITSRDGRRIGFHEYCCLHIEAAVRDRIEFLGFQPANVIRQLRRRAAVVLVPSRFENFPFAVLEAMSQGCAVIASRVGGVPEIIRDGVDGILVDAGDPTALAAQVIRVLRDPKLASAISTAARKTALDRFSPEVLARASADFYEHVLGRAGGAS